MSDLSGMQHITLYIPYIIQEYIIHELFLCYVASETLYATYMHTTVYINI